MLRDRCTIVCLEALDARVLLAGSPVERVQVNLQGTKGDDHIVLKQSAENPDHFAVFGAKGIKKGTVIKNASRFYINTGAGDDRIELVAEVHTSVSAEIDPGAGNDVVKGGSQMDASLEYAGAKTGINVHLGKGIARDGQGGTDTLTNIGGVDGTRFDDTIVIGRQKQYAYITGGEGNDRLSFGRAGRGGIADGPGDDTIFGLGVGPVYLGEGNDVIETKSEIQLQFDHGSSRGVVVRLDRGYVIDGFGNKDRVLSRVHSVVGTPFDDLIIGTSRRDSLWGEAGNDTIHGGRGHDDITGGSGFNVLRGGVGEDEIRTDFDGKDHIDGEGGADTIRFSDNNGATDTVVVDADDEVF